LHWYYFGTGGTALAAAPTPSSATIGNSAYYVSQTVNSCEGPRASIVVTIVAATATPIVTTPVVYCQGTIANPLSATGSGLLWYTSSGGTGNPTAPTPSTSTPGSVTYYVSQTTNCGESPQALITVTVNPTPSAPTVGNPLSYCVGATSVPLTAIGSNLYWYTMPSGGSGISSLTPTTTSVGTTTYYVNQTVLGCVSPMASLDVTITGLPPAPIVNPSSFTYCQLDPSHALTANGSNLLWYTSASGGIGSNASPIPSTLNVGTISYFVSQSLSCGESPRAEITVTTNPTPLTPQVTSPVVYCQGVNSSILTANGNNLLWYDVNSGGIGSSTAPTPSTISTGNTSYFVSATTGSCEGPRAEIIVTVNITPTAPLVNTPLTYCKGNATNPLTATGTNLLWYTTAIGGSGNNISPIPSANTTGTVAYYVSQTIGVCEGPRSNINVVTLSTPNVGPDKKDTVCFGSSYDLTGVFNTTGLSVNWTQIGVLVIDPTLITSSGVYQIDVTNSNGCADTALFSFNVRPPVKAFAGNDTIGVKNGDHQLFATGGDRYEWTPSSMLNFSNIQNPIANLNDDQLFVVTVYNSIGCTDKDSVFIKVYQKPKDYYYIPNAFSPNGDGLNDIFRPIPVGINGYNCKWFKVYNRFGQLLFSTTQWMKGWDGRYKNNYQPIGSYVWSLGYIEKDGSTKVLNGSVLIIK
jgi:gliding motility-associated-like protein